MLKEHTIRKQERLLRRIVEESFDIDRRRAAYEMATALQWVLGGCGWNPVSTLEPDTK